MHEPHVHISAWALNVFIWTAGKSILIHFHRKEMATLSLSQGSLTLLFLSVVTFKKILFPMFCDVLQNEFIKTEGFAKAQV